MEIERPLAKSPLLSEKVIERDYTKGIEGQLGANKPPDEVTPDPAEQVKPNPSDQQFVHNIPSDQGPGPNQFSFDKEITDDPSDITDQDAAGFELASGSAKAFANTVGDIIKVKVPEISYMFVKIDTNSIENHIKRGNINEQARPVFQQINIDTRQALEFSDDEIKMWKKAFKEYLEYKQIKIANPETAFWVATLVLATTQGIKIRELNKNNKQYIVDAINSWNPEYFESFRAKVDEAESKKEDKTEKETKEVKDSKTSKKTL
jgi:hypothetical protein